MNAANTVKPSWSYVSTQTLRRFRAEFQIYFPPALLGSVFAYLCIYLLRSIREKLVVPPSFESAMEPARFVVPLFFYALVRISIGAMQWSVAWLVLTFMLAAVALRMVQERQSPDAPMALGEAFRLVRSRRLVTLAAAAGLVGVGSAFFSIFLLPVLLRLLPLLLFQLGLFRYYVTVYDWATAAFTLIFTALLAKMILAIPELADDQNALLGPSIRNSISATTGWEVFFLLEFGLLGLVGGTLYFAGQDLLEQSWKHGHPTQTGYEMMLAALAVLLAALALSLLAIAHSLIYVSLRYGIAPPLVKTAESGV
jgi:hypothetical protein